LIAGGVSKGSPVKESRSVSGYVELRRKGGQLTLQTDFRFMVYDGVKFCPGNMGSPAAGFLTVPMSRLEASHLAFPVPFLVDYWAPELRLKLSAEEAKGCLKK
jgi:hypothetical protein